MAPSRPRTLVTVVAAALASGLALGACGGPSAADREAVTHTVRMSGTSFVPAEITITAGDRVTWLNEDYFPHTATSEAAGFDSGAVAAGDSWTVVIDRPGTFDYVCSLHPPMVGRLIVRDTE